MELECVKHILIIYKEKKLALDLKLTECLSVWLKKMDVMIV